MPRITNPDTAKWTPLEPALGDCLRRLAGGSAIYSPASRAIPGFPESGFKSDGALSDGRALLAVEVECKQCHPDTNVAKYWMLFDNYRVYERVILVHVFTPAFNSYPWRRKLAAFLAREMSQRLPFEYIALDRTSATDFDVVLAEVQGLLSKAAVDLGLARPVAP